MNKVLYEEKQAIALMQMLHKFRVPYEVVYKYHYSQMDGNSPSWTFIVNSNKVLDALVAETLNV